MGNGEEEGEYLFETKKGKRRLIYWMFAASALAAIFTIWVYRAQQIFQFGGKTLNSFELWGLIGVFCAEIWFGFYWILTQSLRLFPVYRSTFKHRLLTRYKKDELPKVDIFVCTADHEIEPPLMVINTVLSVMAYDYPSEKLSIYLSDDGCSILTFYALVEASQFAKNWLPYCRKYDIEPRSCKAYFSSFPKPINVAHSRHLASIKDLYQEMQHRIETSVELNRVPEDIIVQHKGFSKWDESYTSKYDHDTILQILIDGRNQEAKDIEGYQLPTLVYLAREKRPQHFHNYKAGAMNSLIRVSSEISNGAIILNVDCDMYSNNSQSILNALCFFMDERETSHDIAFVQFPQKFENVTKNDIYGSSLRVISEVEFTGIDGAGGPLYIGSGCFHQREILCGKEYTEGYKCQWKVHNDHFKVEGKVNKLEERAKKLASCTYELNSQWGNQVGLKYGCAVEDVLTGLAIHCRGWKSVYLNPERSGFIGVAATTLVDTLVQHKRWSEGQLQVMLKNCPLWYGHNKISFIHQLGYCHYGLWAVNSLATISYCIIPSLYVLKGVFLYPQLTSPWLLPFAYVAITRYIYSLGEVLYSGGTVLEWWNEQRMWLYKRTSSYLLTLFDTVLKFLGFSDLKFAITTKVTEDDVYRRYEKEIMEFGVDSLMLTILTSLALVNLFTFVVVLKRLILVEVGETRRVIERSGMQILLCFALVLINLPLHKAVFLRKDKGKVPTSVTVKAAFIILPICALFLYL